MAEVLIKYKADAGDLEAVVTKINKVNDEVVKGATDAGKRIGDEFRKAGATAAAAFASEQVKNAFKNLSSEADKLATELQKLQDEQLDLLATGKRVSKEYQDNAKAQAALKVSISEVNKELSKFTNTTEKTEKSQKSLTGQLRGLKQELALLEQQGKDNTKEFNQLLIAASKLEDQIGDTRARVRILASDTFKFDAAVQATQGLAAGFEVAQGAAALFGSESEDLQKAILKVQGAIAVANGVQQIANLLLEESAIKTALLTAKQAIYTTVVGTSTGALKAFRIALAATGVGALVIGLGFLIEKLFASSEATEDATEATNKLAEANQKVADSVAEAATEQELASIRLAKAQGKITDATAKRAEVEAKVNEDLRKNQLQTLTELTEARAQYNENVKALQEKYADDERSLIGSVQIEQRKFEEQRAQIIEAGAKRTTAIRQNATAEVIEFENDLAEKAEQANKRNQKAAKETKKEYDALKLSVGNVTAELLKQDAQLAQTLAGNRVNAAEAAFSKIQLLNQQGLSTAEDVSNAEIELIQQRAISQIQASELAQRQSLEGVKKGSIQETEIIKAGESERAAIVNAAELEVFNKRKDFREKNAAERKKDLEEQVEEIAQIAQQAGELVTGLLSIAKEQSQARIDQINEQSKAELDAINKSAQSEADKQRQREANELRTNRKIAAEKIKQAKLDRATALFEVALNTSIAVSKSIAASPQTFGLPFSAFALAQGLIETGIILSKPLPKYKRGGMVGGKSHEAGGTIIEAEHGEFVVNRNAVSRHRTELDALNTSSAAFKKLIDERYVRPALNYYMGKKERPINVNASLNSKSMERELKGMRRDLKRNNTVININGNDSRYSWHLN